MVGKTPDQSVVTIEMLTISGGVEGGELAKSVAWCRGRLHGEDAGDSFD